jgi:hypothetical protein
MTPPGTGAAGLDAPAGLRPPARRAGCGGRGGRYLRRARPHGQG